MAKVTNLWDVSDMSILGTHNIYYIKKQYIYLTINIRSVTFKVYYFKVNTLIENKFIHCTIHCPYGKKYHKVKRPNKIQMKFISSRIEKTQLRKEGVIN